LRLHSRLVALNVVALGLTSLLLGYFLSGNLKTAFESEIESQLYKSATLAREYVRADSSRTKSPELAAKISKLLDVRVTFIADDGRVLADSEMTSAGLQEMENHSNRPEFIDARKSGRGASIRQSATLGARFIYVAVSLDEGSVLRLAMPLATAEALLSGLYWQLALAMFFGIALSLAFGYMVFVVVSRPLRRMAEASDRLAFGNLNAEIPIVGDRDLATVGSSLNAMARNLRLRMEQLEGDKHRTEGIIAAMSSGVVVFDRDARVVLANQSIQTLLDLHGDAARRIPMELVRHPSIERAVRTALDGSDTPAIEVTAGREKVLLATAAPVRALSGNVELVVVVFHDLTEVRRLEKMRKDFVANLSHEFKTPLTSIRGYAETLLSIDPSDPAVAREFLEAIERNSTLLQTLVDDLLVLARLESELPVAKDRFSVRELIAQQIQARQHLLSSMNLDVDIDCLPIEIEADRARLARALSNLVDNAIHYNRAGGKVRIAASLASRQLRVDVVDTGDGIPPPDLVRVFERFYRVDKSRTRNSGGTGLGLAIARHAIESQGGTLSVTSKLGVGSTFTILLPVS
jgi:two-component system, OmpR family, phosphate regulon sensor histidine kinase PhoR